MNIESKLRKLAKSNYWQTLYRSSKECNGVKLFENETRFSGLQVWFLQLLKEYDVAYTELSQNEWHNLDEDVIKDDDRFVSFMYWRSKQVDKKLKELKKNSKPKKKGFKIYKGEINKKGQ